METVPASGTTSPTSTLNSVVLPLPLAPISPIRSPRSMFKLRRSKRMRLPKVFSMLARVAMDTTASVRRVRADVGGLQGREDGGSDGPAAPAVGIRSYAGRNPLIQGPGLA